MKYGNIDLQNFEYLIKYSTPEEPDVIHTWTLPDGSFQMNYKSMIKRGCIIHNVFRRMSEKELLDVMINS